MLQGRIARSFGFRPVTRDDLTMLAGWLALGHLGGWWGAPEDEIALIEEDLGTGRTDMRIVTLNEAPFAYVQDYDIHSFALPQYAGLAKGARAVDTFVGNPEFMGRGYAQAYLRQRAKDLIAGGAPLVAVDPSPDNTRAIATYRGAGFRGGPVVSCEDGEPVLVLTLDLFERRRLGAHAHVGAAVT